MDLVFSDDLITYCYSVTLFDCYYDVVLDWIGLASGTVVRII